MFEAAIPIAIIAVGFSSLSKRKGALGENVMIQSIGASSGVVVAKDQVVTSPGPNTVIAIASVNKIRSPASR